MNALWLSTNTSLKGWKNWDVYSGPGAFLPAEGRNELPWILMLQFGKTGLSLTKKDYEFRETSYVDLLGSWIQICRRSFKHFKKAANRGFQAWGNCLRYETRSWVVKGDISCVVLVGGPWKDRGLSGD